MENIPLIDKINELTENEYKFTLKSACLNETADFCVIEILYKDGILLSKQTKEKVNDYILSLVPKAYSYEIRFTKNFISEQRIADDFTKFIRKEYSSISFMVNNVTEENLCFHINFVVDNLSYDHAEQKKLCKICEEYLKEKYEDYSFKCSMTSGEVYREDQEAIIKENYKEEEIDMSALRKIEFYDTVHLVGDEITEPAGYIKDKTTAGETAIICGKIRHIKERVVNRKPKQDPESENNNSLENVKNAAEDNFVLPKNAENDSSEQEDSEDIKVQYQRKLYLFDLADFTGEMHCVYFSNKETQAKLEKFDAGTTIAVRGKIQEDKFAGGISLMVHDIAYCSLPKEQEEIIVYHKVKPFYEFVKPEDVVLYQQNSLLDFAAEKTTPKYLQNKTFVCYDLETTGLHYEAGDKMVEIGAVKIVNGKITEKFESLINPEMSISARASEVSGITDADVKDAPKDYQVLQDFCKFKGDAILTGYNIINFDNVFLLGQGKKCRWDFSGEVVDVYNLAQKYVHGVRNYRNGTVYEKLTGKKLENAHRAVYDALATAESLLKIAEIMDAQENESN